MIRIGLLSDTHGYMDDTILDYLTGCNEVWHAGDIGEMHVAEKLDQGSWKFRAVYGNIDSGEVRRVYGENERFVCGGLSVWIRHITGTPGRYTREVRKGIFENKPNILVGGHTHMLRVERDEYGILYLNPGAIGRYGIHKVRTLLRFSIDGGKVCNMEVVELKR